MQHSVSTYHLSQDTAQKICKQEDGDLFSINSYTEFISVIRFFSRREPALFTGSLILVGLVTSNQVENISLLCQKQNR